MSPTLPPKIEAAWQAYDQATAAVERLLADRCDSRTLAEAVRLLEAAQAAVFAAERAAMN
jgi:hypothetical protein